MSTETAIVATLISSLVGSGGIAVVLINQYFTREKIRAEARKIDAEADKAKAETAKILSEMSLTESTNEWKPQNVPMGWLARGSNPDDYEVGVDAQSEFNGKRSAYIWSRKYPRGFGTLMQAFKADRFRGKRLRLSGYARSEGVLNWAGFWMRIDGPKDESLGFDNMQHRPIRGTTAWTNYQIVLDVPENAVAIAFGILLGGTGRVWVNDLRLESVSESMPTTNQTKSHPLADGPSNLNFAMG